MNPAPPPASRKLVLAYIEDHPKSVILLRLARRQAQEKGARWRAVYIETPADMRSIEDGGRERMLRLLTLADEMGGETTHLEAETVEKGLRQILEKEGSQVLMVLVGSIEAEGRFQRWRVLPWMRVVSLASQYAQVEVVPLSGQYSRSLVEKLRLKAVRPHYMLYALLAVGVAYLAASTLQSVLPPALFRINDQNIALLFMIACAFTAGRYGLLAGLVASFASFLTVNYFFTVPYHALKIDTVTDALNMGLFLFATVLISLFTSQTRDYAQKAARRELSTQALFTLYRTASEAFSREQALEKLQRRLERMLEVDVAFFLPSIMYPERIDPVYPAGLTLQENDRKALNASWAEMKTTGLASPYYPNAEWRFEPMVSPAGEIGVFGIRPRRKNKLDAWFGRLLSAVADQTATVLEHIGLERSMEETRLREEREKLRSMLLSSISHDFKTPLAGIIGALSVYRSMGDRLTDQKRSELMDAAIEEAQRLDSFITNILDMTRLESGTIKFRQEWHALDVLVGSVMKRLKQRCRQHEVVVPPISPELEGYMDVMMTEQVLQNVVDNACKYTPAGTRIELRCTGEEGQGMRIEVRDHGAGLPADKFERIFDKYARLQKKDSQVAGTGLGLAISKAIMEAQGGWVRASNHPDGGAIFTLWLPQVRKVKVKHRRMEGGIRNAVAE